MTVPISQQPSRASMRSASRRQSAANAQAPNSKNARAHGQLRYGPLPQPQYRIVTPARRRSPSVVIEQTNRKIAELEATLEKYTSIPKDNTERSDTVKRTVTQPSEDGVTFIEDEVEKVAARIMVSLKKQEDLDAICLTQLANYLSRWTSIKIPSPDLADEIQDAKVILQILANKSQNHFIDRSIMNLCDALHLFVHEVSYQVLSEYPGNTHTRLDLFLPVQHRLSIVNFQQELIQAANNISLEDKQRRINLLTGRVTTQLKIDDKFLFSAEVAPCTEIGLSNLMHAGAMVADLVQTILSCFGRAIAEEWSHQEDHGLDRPKKQ